ncbi:MAG TPA: hypothetical protein VI670_04035 [Thermoanaerobaculia bacterium]
MKSAVLEGVANTDDETAEREAASLRSVLDRIPSRRRAVREALRQERHAAEQPLFTLSEKSADGYAPASVGNLAIALHDVCPNCGQTTARESDLRQFLSDFGFSEEMIDRLKSQTQNVDFEEYLNTAREYLKASGEKAKTYAKENPGKVAVGMAVMAIGAGLLISALNRD